MEIPWGWTYSRVWTCCYSYRVIINCLKLRVPIIGSPFLVPLQLFHDSIRHCYGSYAVGCLWWGKNAAFWVVLIRFSDTYGICCKIKIRGCASEQFTESHTGIEQELQSSVCSWIVYQGNKVVVLIERLEEEKTIVTTFRNYAEVKKAWMEDYTVARVTTGINTEKTDILISVGNFGFA